MTPDKLLTNSHENDKVSRKLLKENLNLWSKSPFTGVLYFQSEHFPFLGTHTSRPYKDMRSRTTFYIALGRLLMVDLGEDEDKFETFMAPITSKVFLFLFYSAFCISFAFMSPSVSTFR